MTKGLDQKIGALPTPKGMLDTETNATPGRLGSFVLLAPWWVGMLVPLAWLPRRDVKLLTTVSSLHAERAEVDTHLKVGTPIHLRWPRLWQPERVVMGPTAGTTKEQTPLVREGPDRVLPWMRVLSRYKAHGASPRLATDDTLVRWPP